jgi:Amt family ammonium transporter
MTQPADRILWLLISTTLLALLVPGVALFYGGMVRRKNVINTMALPFVALAMVSLVWGFVGNGLATGTAGGAPGGPETLLSLNRGMMASVALALLAGAVVERIRFSFFLIFGLCWVVAVYVPLAQWLWGGGWLTRL